MWQILFKNRFGIITTKFAIHDQRPKGVTGEIDKKCVSIQDVWGSGVIFSFLLTQAQVCGEILLAYGRCISV